MARKINSTSTVSFTSTEAKNGDKSLTWDFNEAAIERFGKGAGMRLNIGTAFFLASKDDRDMMVEFFGKGVIRRGLLVLGKSSKASETDRNKAKAMAATLATLVAADVAAA